VDSVYTFKGNFFGCAVSFDCINYHIWAATGPVASTFEHSEWLIYWTGFLEKCTHDRPANYFLKFFPHFHT